MSIRRQLLPVGVLGVAALGASAQASEERIVVTGFAAHQEETATYADAWPLDLAVMLSLIPDATVVDPHSAPPVGGVAASVFLDSCAVAEHVACTAAVARTVEAGWAVTGTLRQQGPLVVLELTWLCLQGTREQQTVTLSLEPERWPEIAAFAASVLEQRIQRGAWDKTDLHSPPQAPAEAPPEGPPPAQIQALEADSAETLGVLVATQRSTPPVGWRRSGALLLELSGGGAFGATALDYSGELLWGSAAQAPLSAQGQLAADTALAGQISLGAGAAVRERLAVLARGGVMQSQLRGHTTERTPGATLLSREWATEELRVWQADVIARGHLGGGRLLPTAELGPSLWWMPLADHHLDAMPAAMPRPAGRRWLGLRAAPGVAWGLTETLDVSLSAPLYVLLGEAGQPTNDRLGFAAGLALGLHPRIVLQRR